MDVTEHLNLLVEQAFCLVQDVIVLDGQSPRELTSSLHDELVAAAESDWAGIGRAANAGMISSGEVVTRIRQLSTDLSVMITDAAPRSQHPLLKRIAFQVETLARFRQELEDELGVVLIGPEDPAYERLDKRLLDRPLVADLIRKTARQSPGHEITQADNGQDSRSVSAGTGKSRHSPRQFYAAIAELRRLTADIDGQTQMLKVAIRKRDLLMTALRVQDRELQAARDRYNCLRLETKTRSRRLKAARAKVKRLQAARRDKSRECVAANAEVERQRAAIRTQMEKARYLRRDIRNIAAAAELQAGVKKPDC